MNLKIRRINYWEKGEIEKAIAIQEASWKFSSPIDIVPLPIFVLSAKFGGLVLGAYIEEEMVGFSLAFPLVEAGETVLHSHMTAVLPEFQGKGIGYEIKQFQRREALKMGYGKITWTFDPLQCRNAYFNLHKLRVRISEYLPDFYGKMSSVLSKGVPTHRFLAEWDTRSVREPVKLSPQEVLFENGPQEPFTPSKEVVGLRIPEDINSLPLKEKKSWYEALNSAMEKIFRGYEILDFERENCWYILKRK